MSNNRVKDLEPIAKLEKIWTLALDGNQVRSLDHVKSMKWLSSLDLRANGLKDISPISSLTELKYLVLEGNQLEDLSTLVDMAKKDADGERRFSPFWRIYLANNPFKDDSKDQIKKIVELGGRVFEESIAK